MGDSTRERMGWVDLVKATSVVLVVFMHVVATLRGAAPGSPITWFWDQAGGLLEPLRMPVFFLVSGMLAARAIQRPWHLSRRRTLGTTYLYVLWSLILVAITAAVTLDPGVVAGLSDTLLFASSGYWYLLALVVYFAVAKLTSTLPAVALLAVAALPNVLRPVNDAVVSAAVAPWTEHTMFAAMTFNLVFFLAGARGRDVLRVVAHRASWPVTAGLVTVAVAGSMLRAAHPVLWPHTFLPLSVAWIAAAVTAASLLTRTDGPLRRFGAYVGPRTLPVFVLQFPALVILSRWLGSSEHAWLASPAVQLAYPLVVTAAVVLGALAVFAAASRPAARWLFQAPDWVVGQVPVVRLRRRPAVRERVLVPA